jgi:ParB family chromosome partitioning protein
VKSWRANAPGAPAPPPKIQVSKEVVIVSERQRGLGRGLAALMGDDTEVQAGAPGVREVPVERLHRNPDQPRRLFSEAEIAELAASIRDKGVLQPILVRPMPGGADGWQIIAGERRWRASQKAGLKVVPVLERDIDDAAVFEIAVVENVQREDLNIMEEAAAYATLISRFDHTQDSVAGVVGKSRSHVANILRLLNLPSAVQEHLVTGRLTAGHARALITAPDAEALAERVIADGLNVRQTEALARQATEGSRPARPARSDAGEGSADIMALEQDLSDAVGLKVRIVDKNGRGEVVVSYGSLEQLDDLCRRLMR